MTPVMAISTAKNNAELIAQAAELGYVGDRVLDATYGLGRFWKLHTPTMLITNDIDPDRDAMYTNDFRSMPWLNDSFDTVVFDPPYKLNGTGGSHASDEAYGVAWRGISRDDKLALARYGATECIRVLRPGGHLLWKCQDQVEGGRVRWQTRIFADHAEAHGCDLVDMLHLPSYRPQPEGTSQQHARRNYSTLLVLRKRPRTTRRAS